jgi:single-strand DNA-binding protein
VSLAGSKSFNSFQNQFTKQQNKNAMKTLRNSVLLIGRLGKDPEVKVFGERKKASFSIATTDSYKNAKGEKVQDTQWHNLVAWGAVAGIAEKYLKKGQEVAIEGKLVHRMYETSAGEKRALTEINVNDIVMLGGKQ